MTRHIVAVAALAACVSARLPAQGEAPPSTPDVVRRLGGLMDSLARADAFSGVVVVVQGGEPVFARAVGFANAATQTGNNIETAFNIGSINKLFTQIAIRQLARQGKISPDSALGAYWPDYPNVEARKATINQLLRHRAGLGGNVFDAPKGGSRDVLRRNSDFLPLFIQEPMAFAPGTNQRYCNACYVVLGELVTRLSGEEYSAYVSKHILAPAGMTRTGNFAKDSLPPNTALGYTRGEEPGATGPRRPNTEQLPGRGSAAGGGYSTAGDLLRLLRALEQGTIAGGGPAGLGIAGGSGGVNAVVEGGLSGGYDVVVLSNFDPPSAEVVARATRQFLGARE